MWSALFFIIALTVISRTSLAHTNNDFACREKDKGKDKVSLPTFWSDKYKVNIELSDLKNNVTAELVNLGRNKTGEDSGLFKWTSAGNKTYQWIFRGNKTFNIQENGKKCSVSNVSSGKPMSLSVSTKQMKMFNIQKWKGILDLLGTAGNASRAWIDNNDTNPVRGIPAEHWTSCLETSDSKYYMQFDVCYSKRDEDEDTAQIPLRVEVQIYEVDATAETVDAHDAYELFFIRSNYSVEDAEKYFLSIENSDTSCFTNCSSNLCVIPKFDVHVEYVKASGKKLDDIQLSYDGSNKVIGFTSTDEKDDVTFASGLGLGKGRFRVIHDFIYGYQYVMSDGGDKCERVEAIPASAGDSVPSDEKEGRVISLKNSTELLIGVRALNFSYVGKRTLDHGIPADVFVAQNKSVSTVYEAWFTTDGWSLSTVYSDFNQSTLVMLDVYHTSSKGVVSRTSQRFHGFTDLNGTSFPMEQLDATACLNKTKRSFVYIELDGPMSAIDKFGRERVKSGLREKLATLANVSLVRIAEFYLEEVADSSEADAKSHLRLFFLVGDQNQNASAATLKHKPEILAEEAAKNLKKALASDVKVKVTDFGRQTLEVKMLKDSFYTVPSDMHPSGGKIVKNVGYSGGSMAALGICMLLIGGVLGLVAAFYFWRRRGAGGAFAYQVYE